jgi:two-component system chemotaxis sensor kinase CheA
LNAQGDLERVIVVLSDVTAEVERARAETDEREATRLFKRLIADRAGFLEFFAEACALVEGISKSDSDLATRKRELHTLKGNALVYGVDSVAQLAHALEDHLAEHQNLDKADLGPLLTRWTDVASKIRELVGAERTALEVEDADYWKLFGAIERRAPHASLRELLLCWRLEPTDVRLRRIAEQAQALAARLGKGPLSVEIESNDLRLAPERWSPFWSAAVHVVRNALDHGLEGPEERGRAGKSAGCLGLRTYLKAGNFVIELSDDGRGIDWSAVRRKAEAIGAPSQSQADLEDALCIDGLSTKEAVTELSGRGVGLGAVRRACQELGGKMELASTPGLGTTVRFVWPAKVLVPPTPRVPRSSPPQRPLGLDHTG